jgi:hypothetical protein
MVRALAIAALAGRIDAYHATPAPHRLTASRDDYRSIFSPRQPNSPSSDHP